MIVRASEDAAERWQSVRLGDVAAIERVGVDPTVIGPGTLYVGLEDISPGGSAVQGGQVVPGELASTKFRFGPEHVLFGKLRPYLAKIALPDFAGVCSTDILPIRPGPGLDRRYLAHFLRQPEQVAVATSRATGANLPRLSPAALAATEIPLPLLSEQRRIAAILDKADDLRTKRCATIAALDTLTESIFLDMFGDPDASWTRCSVEDVAAQTRNAIRTGPFGSQLLHSEFVDDGVAVLGIDNAVSNEFRWAERRFITEAKYQQLSRYRVHPGDVLITIMGTVGRCAVVPDDIPMAINTKHLCCVTLDRDRCLPSYLHAYFLHHPEARRYLGRTSKGAIMDGLNMGLIKEMPIVVPPFRLQEQFATLLARVENNHRRARASGTALDALVASLQARAFGGTL